MDKQFLETLLKAPSPTGFETAGQACWMEHIKPYAESLEKDAYGSAWATRKGSSDLTLLLESHVDEIGYMIKYINEKGFIYIDIVGGSDVATSRGKRLHFLGDQGTVLGVIGNTAIHLRENRANEKSPKIHEVWVDVGANSKEEVLAKGLRVGHPAVYAEEPTWMSTADSQNQLLVSRAIDNRISGYILQQVFKVLKEKQITPYYNLIALNAVQEEIGGYGAQMASYKLHPNACLCLDVTHATDTPGINQQQHGEVILGKGPSVTHGTANHPAIVQKLIETATQANIEIQHESSSRCSGTDTDSIYPNRGGIPSALVSIPLRNMHSTVETVNMKDVEATIDLLLAFITQVNEPLI